MKFTYSVFTMYNVPWINRALNQFADAWNYHPVSSMGNLTPVQVWIAGLSCNSTEDIDVSVRKVNSLTVITDTFFTSSLFLTSIFMIGMAQSLNQIQIILLKWQEYLIH